MARVRSTGAREKLQEALADCDAVLRLNPKNVDVRLARCTCYERRGELDRAISESTEAIGLNLRQARLYVCAAHFRGPRGEHAAAVDDLTAALRCEGMNPADLITFRAVESRQFGRCDAAVADLTVAIIANPRDVAALCRARCATAPRATRRAGEGLGSGACLGWVEKISRPPRPGEPRRRSRLSITLSVDVWLGRVARAEGAEQSATFLPVRWAG